MSAAATVKVSPKDSAANANCSSPRNPMMQGSSEGQFSASPDSRATGSSTVNIRPRTQTTPSTAAGACGKGVARFESIVPSTSSTKTAKVRSPAEKEKRSRSCDSDGISKPVSAVLIQGCCMKTCDCKAVNRKHD